MDLPTINSKLDLKEAKKIYTKLSNKFSDKSCKLCDKIIGDLAKKANKDFRYGDTSELSRAVWAFHCFHPFAKSVVKLPQHIELLKTAYPELAKKGEELYSQLEEEAKFIHAYELHLDSERTRLEKVIDIQAVLKKMADANTEKFNAIFNYSTQLRKNGWKETYIENGELIVNGVNVGKEEMCGIRIGQGIRIHPMSIYVYHDDKENKDYIAIRNYTQWRNSNLVVFDVLENIPKDVLSDRL